MSEKVIISSSCTDTRFYYQLR